MNQSLQQPNRLREGGRIDRARTLSFTFNGKRYQGHAGDTLASALMANGVDIVNRSFKYSRPRGIVAAGAEEPNALIQLGSTEAAQVPNVRATQQALFDGLVARSTNGWPNVQRDAMSLVGKLGGRFMPPGFYYKTFMAPASMWMTYEKFIRKGAGLGRSPMERDPDSYDHFNQHCDLLVIGAGPAGLAAALVAARGGVRVILCDEQEELGGSLLDSRELLDHQPATQWVAQVLEELASLDNVILLPRTTAHGYHDHHFVTLHERRTEHLGETAPVVDGVCSSRSRLHRLQATWLPGPSPPISAATAWRRATSWCSPPAMTTPIAPPWTGMRPAARWWPLSTPARRRTANWWSRPAPAASASLKVRPCSKPREVRA